MAGLDPSSYFDALVTSLRDGGATETADTVAALKDSYARQLWHEFSSGILTLIQTETIVRVAAFDIHDVLLVPVRSNLDGSTYVRLLFFACGSVIGSAAAPKDDEIAASMGKIESLLDSAIASLMTNGHSQCVSAVHCLKALVLMTHGPSMEAKALLQKASDAIGDWPVHEILPILQALYYRAHVRQCELLCDYDKFYSSSFAFRRYGQLGGLPLGGDELTAVAYKTAVAALLADKVYNFGELLNTDDYVTALDASADYKWVIGLIRTASHGNVDQFTRFVADNGALLRASPDLAQAVDSGRLGRKVRLMSLLHLVFHTPADKRVLHFSDIAKQCEVVVSEVEPLLLTAMAQHLIEGSVDELEQTVEVTWVLPRVLSTAEIADLARNIGDWRKTVKQTANYVGKMVAKITS